MYLHYVTKSNDSTFNACPSNSQQDGTYSILQAIDSRQSLLDRRPCMRMLRSDTVDRRCSQGCARWYRDCHGVDLGGGVASCCLGHPCMLEVCSRVPMYSSIESILVGWLLSLPSTIVILEGFIDPRSRYAQSLRKEFNSCIPRVLATRTTTTPPLKGSRRHQQSGICMLGPLSSAFGYWTGRQTSLLQRSPVLPSPLIECTRPVGHSAI